MACELADAAYGRRKHHGAEAARQAGKGILSQVSHCFVTGDPSNRLPNTCNIAFEYIEGEAILLLLNKLGIACSSGSACTSGSLEPSHVMRAMGIPYTAAHGTIRFSLSRYNTEAEVDRVIAAVPDIIAQLRKLSPYWGEKARRPTRKPVLHRLMPDVFSLRQCCVLPELNPRPHRGFFSSPTMTDYGRVSSCPRLAYFLAPPPAPPAKWRK